MAGPRRPWLRDRPAARLPRVRSDLARRSDSIQQGTSAMRNNEDQEDTIHEIIVIYFDIVYCNMAHGARGATCIGL